MVRVDPPLIVQVSGVTVTAVSVPVVAFRIPKPHPGLFSVVGVGSVSLAALDPVNWICAPSQSE
jgi:hypothetical protein